MVAQVRSAKAGSSSPVRKTKHKPPGMGEDDTLGLHVTYVAKAKKFRATPPKPDGKNFSAHFPTQAEAERYVADMMGTPIPAIADAQYVEHPQILADDVPFFEEPQQQEQQQQQQQPQQEEQPHQPEEQQQRQQPEEQQPLRHFVDALPRRVPEPERDFDLEMVIETFRNYPFDPVLNRLRAVSWGIVVFYSLCSSLRQIS
jgi:hypothetical protein